MLIQFGDPLPERSGVTGATVVSRRVKFGSQQEQIVWLRGMVEEYRRTHNIRTRARDIVFRQYLAPPKDQVAQALAIAQWVQDVITYVAEMPETFQTPPTTISEGYGDCDDFTTLIASLCESIGIATEIVGMQWGRTGPSLFGLQLNSGSRYFRHIFPRAVIPMRGAPGGVLRLPLDATLDARVDGRQDPIRIALTARVPNLQLFVA